VFDFQAHRPEQNDRSRRREVADQLAAAIAGYPDELTDLSPEEREAQLKAAFQDPVTREPAPVIWIPQDPAGISEDALKQAKKYGRYLQYRYVRTPTGLWNANPRFEQQRGSILDPEE